VRPHEQCTDRSFIIDLASQDHGIHFWHKFFAGGVDYECPFLHGGASMTTPPITNIVDLNKARLERGEMMFLGCPKCEGLDFSVLVVQGKDSTVIAGLVCCSEKCSGQEQLEVIGGTV
jgi:hypothetical protein